MDWDEARLMIEAAVTVGTDLNTVASAGRVVRHVGELPDSDRYGYNGASGFVARIGEAVVVSVPWSMLEACFRAFVEAGTYDGGVFRSLFRKQVKDHPCHVHLVGMIFVVAGIAEPNVMAYRLVQEPGEPWL